MRMKIKSSVVSRRRRRQSGQELLEFGLLLTVMIPLLLGTFVTGISLVRAIQTNQMDRDLTDMYIHGADFSTYPMQQVAQRLARGLNLQIGSSFANNTQSNTGNAGDVLVTVTQVMYVGATTDTNCVAGGCGELYESRQVCFHRAHSVRQRNPRHHQSQLLSAILVQESASPLPASYRTT